MYRLILVPLDGSTLAERALNYAVELARVTNSQLLLLRTSLVRTRPPANTTEAEICAAEQAYLDLVEKEESRGFTRLYHPADAA